ncbi:MAG TPA: acetate kinase [Ktedonobacterales bacterium]|jgi:acetate kinase
MVILVLNAGSSSLKFSLFAERSPDPTCSGLIDWSKDPKHATLTLTDAHKQQHRQTVSAEQHTDATKHALAALTQKIPGGISKLSEIQAVGHRVVHGGEHYRQSVLIDEKVKQTIADLADLAPLHNPAALQGIEAAQAALPGVPQVAVFDTAFHATIPPANAHYALPYQWYSDWGIRRYGFHGISHAYSAGRAAELLNRPPEALRLVTCHLGNGCSITAIQQGRSVQTTMGFTPLEGVMMGTRSGSVDPGALLYILRQKGLSPEELEHQLQEESGLKGISGLSGDVRMLLEAADQGNERAQLALDMYTARIREAIGAMTAVLGGLDALIFTAGVGEHAALIRQQVCAPLGYLGITLDENRNEHCQPDADISAPASRVRILVIQAREDLLVARETRRLVPPASSR